MDVFQKLAAEYNNSEKPVQFEYKNPPTSVRQRKFGVIIDRVRKILQNGIKEQYLESAEDDEYYWNYLVNLFKEYKNQKLDFRNLTEEKLKDKIAQDKWWEIFYIEDEMHLPMSQKVKQWLVLLLANHKLFEALQVIGKHLTSIFQDPDYMESSEYHNLKKSIDFLADYQFKVACDLVGKYNQYCQERKQRQFLEGLQQIKSLRRQKQNQEQKRRYDLQKINNIRKGLLDMILKEVKLIKDKEEEDKKRLIRQKEAEQERRIKDSQKIPIEQYRARRGTTMMEQSSVDLHNITPTPGFCAYEPHIKKSQKLYRQQFEQQIKQFQFNLEPEQSTQKSECAECKTKISMGLYIVANNINYCNYTGKWFCNQCISPERISIPWKALKNFDLRGYSVCKTAFYEIRAYYDKPVIQIPLGAAIIQKSRVLFDFLIVKRQIHLMYDSICNVELIQGVLPNKLNYCLKQNVFTLHNLSNIYNGSELPALQQIFNIMSKHFYRCKDCQKKGYVCKICNKPDRIFPFQLKETKGCGKCRRLYHINCLRYKPCICSNQ